MRTNVIRAVFACQLKTSSKTIGTFGFETMFDNSLIFGLQTTKTVLGETIAIGRRRTRKVGLGLAI